MEISLHRVNKIKIKEIGELILNSGEKKFYREMKIKTERGEILKIVLFSERKEDLKFD